MGKGKRNKSRKQRIDGSVVKIKSSPTNTYILIGITILGIALFVYMTST